MDVTIRSAATTDAEAISILSKQLGYDMNISDTAYYLTRVILINMDTVVVATIDDNVVGWMHVVYVLRLECNPFCEIMGLVVDENYRGKGIGKILIAYAMQWSKTKDCHKLRVRTNIKRTNTHKFYLGAGFDLIKEQKIFEMNL